MEQINIYKLNEIIENQLKIKENRIENLLQILLYLTNSKGILVFEFIEKENLINLLNSIFPTPEDEYNKFIIDNSLKIVKEVFSKSLVSKIDKIEHQNYNWYFLSSLINKKLCIILILKLSKNQEKIEPFFITLQLISSIIKIAENYNQLIEKEELALQSGAIIEIIGKALRKDSLDYSINTIIENFQEYLNSYRIILGTLYKNKNKLKKIYISKISNIDKKSNFYNLIKETLYETLYEENFIIYSIKEKKITFSSHKNLANILDAEIIISDIILNQKGEKVGVWTFIWLKEQIPHKNYINIIKATSPYIGDLIDFLSISYSFKILRKIRDFIKKREIKFIFLTIFIFFMWLILFQIKIDYKIKCKCLLKPYIKYSVTAPFDSILKEVYHKAGDKVKKGEIIAKLESRDLKIELLSIQENISTLKKKKNFLFAQQKISEYQITLLELKKMKNKKDLIEYKLKNLKIISPITGIILKGDLENSKGAPLKIGTLLFEIAPLNKIIIEVYLKENNLKFIKKGQKALLKILPYLEKEWEFKIEYISPIAEIKENENVFILRGIIDNKGNFLKPGMKGRTFIFIGKETISWILFHNFIEWIKF